MSATPGPAVRVLECDDHTVRFVLDGAHVSMANALRRAMLVEVPTLAVELVTIETNTSVLKDVIVAHRLGLLPVRSAPLVDRLLWPQQCDCARFCDKCAVAVQLQVEVPASERDVRFVTTDDFTLDHGFYAAHRRPQQPLALPASASVLGGGASGSSMYAPVVAATPMIAPQRRPPLTMSADDRDGLASIALLWPLFVPGILIAKLAAGQQLQLRAIVQKGLGRTHMKWSPVEKAVFETAADVVDLPMADSNNQDPPRSQAKTDQGALKLPGPDSDQFVFTVDSAGAFAAADIVVRALDVLAHKTHAVAQAVRRCGS